MQVLDEENHTVTRYLAAKGPKTAQDYRKRLVPFRSFIHQKYNLSLDELVKTMTVQGMGPKIDVYDMFQDYVSYIQTRERKVSPLTLRYFISTVRNYLETFDVEISPRKFELKVGMPRAKRQDKEPLSKKDVQTILGACHNLKFRTYILTLAATAMRASEALSIRICDINFETDPATIFIRGEFTKTGSDRTVMITKELAHQLQQWIAYKHRMRTLSYSDSNKKRHYKRLKPAVDEEALLFSVKYNKKSTIGGLYTNMVYMFEKTLDRLGGRYAQFEYGKQRRKITLHSLRRHAKSAISNLGYEQYSEYFLGHNTSTYWRATAEQKVELFRKCEPALTYLDMSSVEQRGQDIQSQFETMQKENLELRQQFTEVMEMIRDNPVLAKVKPEVLIKKKEKKNDKT